MKISFVLCEGSHDIAFLSKLLYAHGYSNYESKISKYPEPLNNLFKKTFEKESISDKVLGKFASNSLIPSMTLKEDENLVLFNNMGGDGTIKKRYDVIDQYLRLKNSSSNIVKNKFKDINIEFLLFYDADDLGVDRRVEYIKKIFDKKYDIDISRIINGKKFKNEDKNFDFGCYVFHRESDLKGTLEDVLIDLMRVNNEDVFKNPKEYLQSNMLDTKRSEAYSSNSDNYKGRSEYKENKSLISVAGQLQFSGSSNAVIISKSDYIKRDDILNSKMCKDIIELFR